MREFARAEPFNCIAVPSALVEENAPDGAALTSFEQAY